MRTVETSGDQEMKPDEFDRGRLEEPKRPGGFLLWCEDVNPRRLPPGAQPGFQA